MILLCNVYSFKNTSLRMSIKKVWRTFLLMGVFFFFSFSFHLYHWSSRSTKTGPDYLYLVGTCSFHFCFQELAISGQHAF